MRPTQKKAREYYQKNWSKRQVTMKKYYAKKHDIPFDMTASDIPIPETCPVLDIPIFFREGNGPLDNSPSIDRIRPELGYVKGNVIVISMKANRIKNDATVEELRKVHEWLKNIL